MTSIIVELALCTPFNLTYPFSVGKEVSGQSKITLYEEKIQQKNFHNYCRSLNFRDRLMRLLIE